MTKAAELAKMGEVLTNSQIGGRRNIVINGAMQVAQRGTSFTSVTASAYHLDRFKYNLSGTVGASTVTQNTVTDLAGFTKSLKVDVTTADASLATSDRLTLVYNIEGQDLQQVAKGTSSAEQLTLSFYIKATKTGTQIVELFDHDNTRHCAKSVTINSSNTWEKKTITYPADTTGALNYDNTNAISIFFGLACGTDFTSGTLATAWASNTNANRFVGQVNHFDSTDNNFEITGVQLEVGEQATPFEHRSFGEELALCQRYFYVHADGSITSEYHVGVAANYASTALYMSVYPRVTMRAAPTLEQTTGTNYYRAFSTTISGNSDYFDEFVITSPHSQPNIFEIKGQTNVSVTAGEAVFVRLANSSAKLFFDAEL